MDYFHLSHSGARIWRQGALVYKVGGPRLRFAAKKQQEISTKWFRAPKVLDVYGQHEVTLVQEWVGGHLPLSRSVDAMLATGAAAAYVLGNQNDGDVSVSPMIERLRGVAADEELVGVIIQRLGVLGALPAGRTHGDMTFCNMLVNDAVVYAMDFSDVTVESPLLDAVKLRQDTFHGWAARLTNVDPSVVADADARLHEVFSAALRGYTAAWPVVSAWSLMCRVFAYGDSETRAWAEREAWRCIRSC